MWTIHEPGPPAASTQRTLRADRRASPCRRWSCWPPSRSTCSSTPPWSVTSAGCRWPRSPSAAASCRSRPGSARVLAYGTTGRAARRFGAGDRAAAVAEGVQASWLALAAGVALALLAQVVAGPLTRRAGRRPGDRRRPPPSWLRIAALGAPGLLLALGRQRLDARRAGHPPTAASTCSAPTCSPPCSARCWSTRPGWAWPARRSPTSIAQTLRRPAVPAGAGRRAGRRCGPRPAVIAPAARARPGPADPRRRLPGLLPVRRPRWRPASASRRSAPTRSPCSCGSSARSRWTRWRSPRSRWSAPRWAPATAPAARDARPPGRPCSAAVCGVAFAALIAGRRRRACRGWFSDDPAVHDAGDDRLAVVRRRCCRWPAWCSPSTAC